MSQRDAHHIFLPWLRRGLAAEAATEDTPGATLPGRVTMQVQMRVNNVAPTGEPDDVTVRLHGPGDVIGIDPQIISRTEPQPRYPIFEPNYFPFVEFTRPDFPWLFTPARATTEGRLRPWLALVVLPRGMGVSLSFEPGRNLPLLDAPRAELPDLSESWAWAHSQVTRPLSSTTHTIPELLSQYPQNAFSRLICPRRLLPSTDYLACLVPAFESGRKAGLGDPLMAEDEAGLSPAWLPLEPDEDPDSAIRLPVYYHWEFRTGVAGDFEALVRRLEVRPLPAAVGIQTVDMHDPGWGLTERDPEEPGALMEMGGVFASPTGRAAPWEPAARNDFESELRAILNGPPDVNGSPVVKPPVYGQEHARAEDVPEATETPHWLRELNLDPRYRIAAGMGAMVIRYEQERLMESAWKQLAAAERSQQEQRRRQFRAAVTGAISSKRLEALSVPAEGASGFRSLGGVTAERVLVSTANGSFARRLQARRQVAADPGAALPGRPSAFGTRSVDGDDPNAPEPYRFSPSFPQPVLEWIRDYYPGMLLPGLSLVPPNTIALLESNPALIEAFMVGLNHEMGRELLWREFPVDRRGTFFRNVWDDPAAANELPPIAEWSPDSHLGDHLQQGIQAPADPALDAQIEAAQTQIGGLEMNISILTDEIASLALQRQQTYDEGEPAREQLDALRNDEALIDTREFERDTAASAATQFDALADAAEDEAASIRAAMAPLLADLAALQAIAAQIPAIEASLQALQQQIVDLTGLIEGIPALRAQLEQQRDAAQDAITATEQEIASIQVQVATIPDLQQQVTVAEQEAAQHEADGNHERNIAAQIRDSVAPQRRRLEELELVAQEASRVKDKIIELRESWIPQKEMEIQIHREQEPPRPPDSKLTEPETRGPGLPGPGQDWETWYRRLLELEAELEMLQRDLADQEDRLAQMMIELEEVPILQAQVDAAEQEAAPHDQAADLAFHLAAQSSEQARRLRRSITTIQERAGQIPALELEIQNQQQIIADRSQQIEGLPAYQADLENQRAQAQSEADTVTANLADVQAQVAGMPALQDEIAAIEATAAEQDSAAANYRLWAAQERAKIPILTDAIATLQASAAQIPTVAAQVQANAESVTMLDEQVAITENLRGERAAELAAARAQLSGLLNERTLSRSQLVLVIRGDLLRRFPRARIYAVEARWSNPGQTEREPDPDAEPLQALFRQSWGLDLTFFGFPMTGKTARGTGGHPGWYFILEEPPGGARFGLDAPTGASRGVDEIGAWDTLRWDDMAETPEALLDLRYISPAGRLDNEERELFTDPGDNPPVNARWGRNSAHMALITRQRPARMEIHASLWLP